MPDKMTLEEMLTEVGECMGKNFRANLESAIDSARYDYGSDRYSEGYDNATYNSYCDRVHAD